MLMKVHNWRLSFAFCLAFGGVLKDGKIAISVYVCVWLRMCMAMCVYGDVCMAMYVWLCIYGYVCMAMFV